MTRVEEQREAQRLQDAKKKAELDKAEKQVASVQFSKVMGQQKQVASDQNRRGQEKSQTNQGQKSNAQNALLARQGIHSNRLATTLHEQGDRQVTKVRSELKERREDNNDKQLKSDERSLKSEGERRQDPNDKLAPISRDAEQEHKSFGDSEHESGGGGAELGGQQAQHLAEPGMPKATQAAARGEPRIPTAVLEALVARVYAGVSAEGLSQFTVELREGVLGGARVDITAKDGKISCTVHTKDKDVGRLLKASEHELHQAFAKKGLTLEKFAVQS